ncbi:MAG: biopolymer transporter ExbD [Spirochaetales bacterium]|nr:biopolymer transporter ExbD [Spirochaetales bacterium]
MKLKIRKKSFGVTLFAMPDIAFLLLIFLILTTSVDEQGDIKLPEFRFLQGTDFPEIVVISLSRDGEFLLSGNPVQKDELPLYLSKIPDNKVINILADRNVRYSEVDDVLALLQDNGLLDVVLIMEEPVDDE